MDPWHKQNKDIKTLTTLDNQLGYKCNMNRYYCLRWLLSILKLPWYLGVFARGVRSKSGLWCCTHELGAPVQTSKKSIKLHRDTFFSKTDGMQSSFSIFCRRSCFPCLLFISEIYGRIIKPTMNLISKLVLTLQNQGSINL